MRSSLRNYESNSASLESSKGLDPGHGPMTGLGTNLSIGSGHETALGITVEPR